LQSNVDRVNHANVKNEIFLWAFAAVNPAVHTAIDCYSDDYHNAFMHSDNGFPVLLLEL